jgi:magnesium chelatase family protein
MEHNIKSILISGSESIAIEAECQLSNGLPSIIIVGLANKAIDEAKERIRSAFASTKIELPRKRITINLAPADIPKESTSLDLAIAGAIISAKKKAGHPIQNNMALIGEVGLNGSVRPVRGIIGKIVAGRRLGITTFIIPAGNIHQAALVPGVELLPISSIQELYAYLVDGKDLTPHKPPSATESHDNQFEPSLSSVAGQEQAKRVLEIAAAGGHNILLYGPPGTGKSLLAKCLPSLLPPLTQQEMLEVTHLHSLASFKYDQLVTQRPFRSPHHSASSIAILGGGNSVLPGEITLGHRGVLLLDEFPEFDRQTIEALRQPLEDKVITISRAKRTIDYPADFILVATANPCPCGFYGSAKECQCSSAAVQRYQRKFSGPILDRIDMFVQVNTVAHELLLHTKQDKSKDAAAYERVMSARKLQENRYHSQEILNSHMSSKAVISSGLSKDAALLLNKAAASLNISARGYLRIIKVARTIADLNQSPTIRPEDVSEALQYRELRLLNQ